jgi:hypothetical protein
VNAVAARWWVYSVATGAEAGTEALPRYWVYDRLLQRSAWIRTSEPPDDVGKRVERWAEGDQYVESEPEFEVFALRSSVRDPGLWEGFAFTGVSGMQGMPEHLNGFYGMSGEESRLPVRLEWSAEQTRSLEHHADWETLLKALAEDVNGE